MPVDLSMNSALKLAISLAATVAIAACNSSSTGRSFGVAELIENQVGSAGFADVGLSMTGEAVIVWSATEENNPLDRLIYASQGLVGGNWSAPLVIDNRLGDPFSPRLAMSPNGTVIAVWEQVEDVNPEQHAYANNYDLQAGWGSPIALSSPEHQERPRVSINAAGAATAVWQESGVLGGSLVYSSDYTEQSGWSAAIPVDEDKDSASFPRVTVDSTGRAIVAWTASEGFGSSQLFASRQVDNGIWGVTELLDTTSQGISTPEVVADSLGNALIVWSKSELGQSKLFARSYESGFGWTSPVEIGVADGVSARSAIAFDAEGNAVVVWEQHESSTIDIYSARRSVSGDWGGPLLLETLDGDAEFPDVAADAAGNAIATWRQFDGEADSIYAALFTPNGGWQNPELLETVNDVSPLGDAVGVPQIAMNAGGDAIVVWPQFDGQNFSVFVNWFK